MLPEELSLCFFAFAGAPSVYLAERIRSSSAPCSIEQGYPKERLTFRRAQGLGESAESGRLSPCQQSKTVSLKVWRGNAATTSDNLR
jgi:hypothetical protein